MKHGVKITHWSTEEINILKDNFSSCTNKQLMDMLPLRTIDSIKQRARLLKLKKIINSIDNVYKNYRMIHSGSISVNGNVTTHRMM
jgi:hypothetical protein